MTNKKPLTPADPEWHNASGLGQGPQQQRATKIRKAAKYRSDKANMEIEAQTGGLITGLLTKAKLLKHKPYNHPTPTQERRDVWSPFK